MRKLLRSEKGQSATEYAIMVAVIVGIVVLASTVFRPQIKAAFEQLGMKISQAIGTVSQ
ncbi:MAG: class III signal peptide-containing protein [Elusimicrobia bacterium]|nr:class III signal peptide-containing protein [Elusimicrobiota bacterium]